MCLSSPCCEERRNLKKQRTDQPEKMQGKKPEEDHAAVDANPSHGVDPLIFPAAVDPAPTLLQPPCLRRSPASPPIRTRAVSLAATSPSLSAPVLLLAPFTKAEARIALVAAPLCSQSNQSVAVAPAPSSKPPRASLSSTNPCHTCLAAVFSLCCSRAE
ncbi:hypothetical protein M0R45_001688 [Rubus argutus]|uniref:Uncharacterized protein n=1 Tax=Rubus argutus TaxID=59490 RepID=A0AAW1VGK5_RUBAR